MLPLQIYTKTVARLWSGSCQHTGFDGHTSSRVKQRRNLFSVLAGGCDADGSQAVSHLKPDWILLRMQSSLENHHFLMVTEPDYGKVRI